MSVDDWFRELSTSSRLQSNPERTQALQEYLTGKTPAHSAAKSFSAIVKNGLNDSDDFGDGLYNGLFSIWVLVLDIARDLPQTQDKLVKLLIEIEKLPDLEHDGRTVDYHGMKVWNELPGFGWQMRDCWNYFDLPPDHPDQAGSRLRWLNINAFAARITASECTAEFNLFGLWSLRDALEDEPWMARVDDETGTRYTQTGPDELKSRLDGLVPAAAQWIFYAGRALFECKDQIEPGGSDPMKGGALWSGRSGFFRERWDLWKKRFEWVQAVERVTASTKEMAKQAVESMSEIEGDT